MIRNAHCRGWYPEEMATVRKFLPPAGTAAGRGSTLLGVVPHAGWIYSGKVAGKVYGHLAGVDTVVFFATNHTGMGPSSSLFPEGTWRLPLGEMRVDADFAARLLKSSRHLKADVEAHLQEHAIEVQIPFLLATNPEARIVPIEMRDYRFEVCREIGQAAAAGINEALRKNPDQSFAVIASTDLTHCGEVYGQIPPETLSADAFARRQDRAAIERILSLDAADLEAVVKKDEITMCGLGPAMAMMEAARALAKKQAQLLDYATSCDVSGKDSELAVGYAGILVQ